MILEFYFQMLPYEKRPVWYVFSGMGTQWPGMAKDLMRIKIFRESIKKSEEILKPYVPDLMDILNNELRSDISLKPSENTNRKIIPAFVSIAAMQVIVNHSIIVFCCINIFKVLSLIFIINPYIYIFFIYFIRR